jgi:hypothetical protein
VQDNLIRADGYKYWQTSIGTASQTRKKYIHRMGNDPYDYQNVLLFLFACDGFQEFVFLVKHIKSYFHYSIIRDIYIYPFPCNKSPVTKNRGDFSSHQTFYIYSIYTKTSISRSEDLKCLLAFISQTAI